MLSPLQSKKIICLYGGPGSGKSTTQAALFASLKMLGWNCEMVREYIKNWCWEDRKIRPGDQTYFFAKQSRQERVYLEAGLDFIITDSPLILSHFYGMKYDWMEQKCNTSKIMLQHHHTFCREMGYKVEHFLIQRNKAYNPAGRYQTEQEARTFDTEIEVMLNNFGIKFEKVNNSEEILAKLPIINN